MKTKKLYITHFILMLLPLIVSLIALPFLPNQIPAHFDFNNEVTRYGSKYETLIIPATVIGFGFFMLVMAQFCKKHEKDGSNNEKICIITGIVTLILFNAMAYYFLYVGFNSVENLSDVSLDINQLTFGILGIMMIIIGNIMPKTRMNSLLGLRTVWSMKNETTWKKSQHFCGISFIIGGLVMVVLCFLTSGFACIAASLGIIVILVIVDTFYTYKAAKNN